jgi:hypothetical protein
MRLPGRSRWTYMVDWEPNREAARLIAAEIEKAVSQADAKVKAALVGSLSAIGEETHSASSCKLLI